MYVALGRTNKPNKQGVVVGRPGFVGASNLSSFITNDLERSGAPIRFRPSKGSGGLGGVAFGYRAEILPMVCHVFEDAEREGKLLPNQLHIAQSARLISRSFSKLGIIALVDEASGFQYDHARDALARILEKFIAKELLLRTFPLEFYEQIFRLKGWRFDPAPMQGPRCLAQMNDDLVYHRLAPDVLKHLREKNPIIDGRRKHKHFQWLTGYIGHPRLLSRV